MFEQPEKKKTLETIFLLLIFFLWNIAYDPKTL